MKRSVPMRAPPSPGAPCTPPSPDARRPTPTPRPPLHPPERGRSVTIAGIEVLPLAFEHGHLRVFGYRFGRLAYITDVKAIPEREYPQLQGLEVLVLNALWWRSHPTHLSISEAIDAARALGARRTYLTHLTHETGHAELEARLPAGIFPAHDGRRGEGA